MSKKLLLADDSITIQKVIQITFAHEDYELTITDNGDSALSKAQEITPDLIMADVYMPGKNGYELTTAVRQDEALKNVPVLLLAGSFEPFDEEKAKACKANAWVEKPFESQNLIDKVSELLSAAPAAPPAEVAASAVEPEMPVAPAVEAPALEVPEPVTEVAAASNDPFGDISFAEEPATAPEPEPVAVADDWSDVAEEPGASAPAAGHPTVVNEEPVMEAVQEPVFAEPEPVVAEPASAIVESNSFDIPDEDIMPLDEDDILGAEDLEAVPQEQTLASWSRDTSDADDVFGEPVEEQPLDDAFLDSTGGVAAVAASTAAAAVVSEEVPAAQEPSLDEAFAPASEIEEPFMASDEQPVPAEPVFEEPAPEPAVLDEVVAAPPEPFEAPEIEPASVAATMVAAEGKAAAMGEDDIEKIVEKVVEKVVEKLAGTILERVAWEVVPDMAESIIKEEIRKIKDAAA